MLTGKYERGRVIQSSTAQLYNASDTFFLTLSGPPFKICRRFWFSCTGRVFRMFTKQVPTGKPIFIEISWKHLFLSCRCTFESLSQPPGQECRGSGAALCTPAVEGKVLSLPKMAVCLQVCSLHRVCKVTSTLQSTLERKASKRCLAVLKFFKP